MNDRQWERLGASSGIVFVVLLLIVVIFFPAPPDFDAPPQEIAEYYIDDRDAIQISNLIGAVALFFLIWFLGSVRSVLRAAEGGTGRLSAIAFGGGLVGVATFFFALIVAAAAAFRPEETTPDVLRLLHDINFGLAFALGGLAFAVFFAATALVALRTGAFPASIGWLAAAAALALAVGGATIFDDNGAFSADGFFGFLPVIFVLAWVLATSSFLVSRPGARPVGGVRSAGD
jgi:hypothetical protein